MANLLDYLQWRGDLPLSACPLCDVDALVLARLSYIPFEGVVPAGFGAGVSLRAAARQVLTLGRLSTGKRGLEKEDSQLLSLLIDSPRFAALTLCGYESTLDPERQEQFAALTVRMPDGACIAFRGTDGTLIGWKEDFNMAFSEAVPAQLHAVEYLRAAAVLPGALHLCGHSKGGNLAVYAAAFCEEAVQQRIAAVRSFDGPGFNENVVRLPCFDRILPRTRTYLPQDSLVGMLLEHEEAFIVVESQGSGGVNQHNLYLWEIYRGGFREVSRLSGSSQLIDRTLKDWLAGMTREQREKVINGLYTALTATQAETVREVRERKKLAALRAILESDEETRRLTLSSFRILYHALRRSLPGSPLHDISARLHIHLPEKNDK